MTYRDLREFIAQLEATGDLMRVSACRLQPRSSFSHSESLAWKSFHPPVVTSTTCRVDGGSTSVGPLPSRRAPSILRVAGAR